MQYALDELDRLIGERSRHRQDYERVLADRDDEFNRLERSDGPTSERWKMHRDNKSRARTEDEAIAGQLGRPVNRIEISSVAFWVLALMLAVIETPVNKFLFDVSLQSSNATSYLVSFAVAVFVLVAAHAAGKSARQVWSEYRTKHHWSNIALSIGVLIVLLGVVSVLTIGRGEFAAARLDPGLGGVFSAVKEKVVSIGFWGALSHALADTSALVLMTINIASIMVAFLLGFLSHDPDKHFDKAFERHKACQVSMERYEAKYSKAVSSICEQARKKLNAINIRYSAANAAIVAQKTARRIPLDDEDRFSLPRLDRMLVRASEQSGSIFGAGSPTIATPAMS